MLLGPSVYSLLYEGSKSLGCHDEDVRVGGRCYAGCDNHDPMNRNFCLTCVQRKGDDAETPDHEAILEGLLAKAPLR